MRKIQWLALILTVLIGGAGCVQLASDAVAPAQVGENATWTVTPSETFTPLPSETPTATIVEPTDPALPGVTSTPISSATPTATDTPTPTPTATATEAVSARVAAQDDAPPIDNPEQGGGETEFQATATALIENATQTTVAIETQMAIDAGVVIPTNTPLPAVEPTIDPGLGAGTAPTQAPAAVAPGANCIHEVRAQDRSLYRLSLAYGVPVMDIARASGIVNPDMIRVGQRLTIPGCGTTGGIPPATSTPGPNAGVGGTTGTGGVTAPGGDCSWGTSVTFPSGCLNGAVECHR
jgi:LysM repeat protein